MINRIKNSLAFRLPTFYKLILRYFIAPPIKKETEFTDEYNLVILCGSKQVGMLQVCLKSIYNRFQRSPHIYLFTDLNVNIDKCRKAVSWFPADKLSIISGSDCLAYHLKNKNDRLVAFAKKNPMGLKLAAILQVLDNGKPVMYCDTDVIWYDDPIDVIKQHLDSEGFELVMSEDFQPAYDLQLIEKANLETLYRLPYFCAGILLVKELSERSYKTIASLLSVVEHQSNHFSEQTIFAFLNKESNDLALNKDGFLLRTEDQFEIRAKSMPGVIARHYIGPVRHLFWRDALWLK